MRAQAVIRAFLRIILLALSLGATTIPSRAVEPDEMLQDRNQEARARSLSAELRCLVCQNQSIDESDAALAKDLRRLVRQRIVAGDSDDAVKAFLVSRYGEFVLLRPPVTGHTWLLWALPFLTLGVGAVLALRFAARRKAEAGGGQLDPEEEARLQRLLEEEGA